MKKLLLLLLWLGIGPPILLAQLPASPFSGTITGTGCMTVPVGNKGTVTFQVTGGSWTGTIQPEGTIDGNAAFNIQVIPFQSTTAQNTITANGIYTLTVAGLDSFKLCGNTVTNTATVKGNAVQVVSKNTPGGGAGGSGTVASGVVGEPGIYTAATTIGSSALFMDASQFAGADASIKFNACVTAAIAAKTGCDARSLSGNQTLSVELQGGDAAGDPVTIYLPDVGTWTTTVNDGTHCGLRHFGGSSIIGSPASGLSKLFKIANGPSGNPLNIYCTDTTGGNYFYASGFTIYNQSVALSSGVGMYVGNAIFDSSTWDHIYVLDGKDTYAMKVEGTCCSASFRNMQIDGEYGTGVTPLWVNQGGQGVNFVDLSVVKPGAGFPLIKVTDALHKMTVNFKNLYSETSNSDTTTALYQFGGAAAINMDGVGFHSNVASSTATGITLDNTYNTMLTVQGLTMGPGAGTFTYPAQAITDNNSGYSVPTNTAGNVAAYPPPGYGVAVTAESFGASPSATTSVNTTAIQAALTAAAGGEMSLLTPGTYQVNGTLVTPAGGNIHVRLGPKTKIIEVTGGTAVPILVNSAYNTRASTTAVTLTWSSGINFSVAWTAHGVSVGQYVWLSGSSPSYYNGVFQVISVTDANNFTVDATRAITATPTGSAVAKVCDQNIIVEGGIWDYNFPTNTDPSVLLRHAIIMGVAEHVTMRDMKVNNGDKYTGEFSAIRDLDIENWGADFTGSDLVKIYGPAYNVKIDHLWGRTGDDGVTVQPNEGVAFAAYVWSGGGDIQGVHISNVAIDGIVGTACVGAYGALNEILDDVQVDTVACQFPAGSAVAVSGSTTTNNVKNVMFKNISGDVKQYLVVGATVAADNIDISGITVDPLNPFSGSMISINNGAVIGNLSIENTDAVWTAGSSSHLLQSDGTVGVLTMDGVKFNPTGTAWNLYFAGSNAKVTKLTLHHINMTAGTVMLQLNGTSTVPNISITDSICTTCTSILSTSVSANISMARNYWTNASGGVIRSTSTPTINWSDFGSNLVAGSWQVTASGTPVLTSTLCDLAGNCTHSNSNVVGGTATTFGSSTTQQSAACETTYGITTLGTGGLTTDTGLNCLPANSVIDAVVYRITTTIVTTTSFTIGDATTAARFCTTQSTLTAGTTGICFIQADQTSAAGPRQVAAAKVRFTAIGIPSAGAIRFVVYYHTWAAPTS